MKRDVVCTFAKGFAITCCAIVWLASRADAASVVVMESSIASLQRGQELTDDQRIDIPSGNHLLVGVIQNAQLKQVDIAGPRSGSVKDLLNPEPASSKLWRMLVNLIRTGGASESSFGAARAIRVVQHPQLLVNDVPVADKATICVEEGTSPTIRLGSGNSATLVRLSEILGTQSEALNLPTGPAGVPWPAAVPLRDAERYSIKDQSNKEIVVEVHLVASGALRDASSVKTLELLAARGCEQQAAAVLNKPTVTR
jgi:hypothetical protein